MLVATAFVGLALVWSAFQTPRYEARAKLLLQPQSSESLFESPFTQRPDPARAVQTEIELLRSAPVREEVLRRVGEAPTVSGRPVGQTDVIDVVVEHGDPEEAAEIATAYANAYIDIRRERVVDSLLAASKQIQKKLSALQAEIDSTQGSQRDSLVQQYGAFRQKLDQLQVDSELRRGGAQLVAEAGVPTEPVAPRPLRSGVFALILGAALGVGVALFLEYLDDSVKTEDDVRKLVPGAAVIGMIPAVASWKERGEPRVVSVDEPSSPPAEAYRTLRTAVQFLSLERPVARMQVTSASAGEGKTTTLANLGVALARSGRRVVVVCCDLRRPRLHEFFGLSNRHGLTSVLLGETTLEAAVQSTEVERLHVLASGPLPPNPSELLASRRVGDLLDRLAADGYLVLLDSPPLLPVTDAMVLSKRVDATLLVASSGSTKRDELKRAVDLLTQVNAPLAGVVLNRAPTEEGYGYGYYRSYEAKAPANGSGASNGDGRPVTSRLRKAVRGRQG